MGTYRNIKSLSGAVDCLPAIDDSGEDYLDASDQIVFVDLSAYFRSQLLAAIAQ
ncbi:MAG: hypothetical protein AAF329_19235 [Cyanobacteria bacterium P01_A01_bin.17]